MPRRVFTTPLSTARSLFLAATGIAAVTLALSGCSIGNGAPTPAVSDAPAPSSTPASPSASPVSKPPTSTLPADALIQATTTVAQANGAKLKLTLVVHAPVAWNSTAGTPMSTAMSKTCDGEIDSTVLAAGDDEFVEVDVTATALPGAAWGSVPIGIDPVAGPDSGFNEAAVAPATQVEIVGANPPPGGYVPTCLQPAVITGASSSKVYFSWGTDTGGGDPHVAWAGDDYGFSIPSTPDGSAPTPLTFSGCTTTVTPLAMSSVPGHTWVTGTTNGTECLAYS